MLSVVTCSINQKKLAHLRASLTETVHFPYELIVIDNSENAYSISQAYNLGAERSKYDFLCFVHEDIVFKNKGWDKNFIRHLTDKKISLIGILGNIIKTKIPSGVYSKLQYTNRINQIQRLEDNSTIHYFNNPYEEEFSEVATLDGMLLGTIKKHWQKIHFDEQISGFHAYDISYSLAMAEIGKVGVVYDILIEHSSYGNYQKDWIQNQIKVTDKWKKSLPIQKANSRPCMLKLRKEADLIHFTTQILNLNYDLDVCLKYSALVMLKYPLNRFNLFILKKLIIRSLMWLKLY